MARKQIFLLFLGLVYLSFLRAELAPDDSHPCDSCLRNVSAHQERDRRASEGTKVQRSAGSAVFLFFNWQKYYSLRDCKHFLEYMYLLNPQSTSLQSIGRTFEGREIRVFKIAIQDEQQTQARPIVVIEAGIHGNEWIAPATATFIIYELLSTENELVKELARSYEWYIIPHANPDGYEHSRQQDPLWRKNRSPNGFCYGVDLNRNFDFHWNNTDYPDPCSKNYAGPGPASELETKALTAFVASLKNISLYVSLQGYSQKLMYPYGYGADAPSNQQDLEKVAQSTVQSLEKYYGTKYTAGSMHSILHSAPGSSMDWVYGTQGVQMAFTYKLRPSGATVNRFGKGLADSQIQPTAQETFYSLMTMVHEIRELNKIK